jgi:hypothetical protein
MNKNVIILKDIVTMSDSEDQDVKTEKEEKTLNPVEKAVEKKMKEHEDQSKPIQPPVPDAKPDKQINTDDIKVSKEDLEHALEKVVKKLFADKIDPILEKVIEDVVSKEIKVIEQSLTD